MDVEQSMEALVAQAANRAQQCCKLADIGLPSAAEAYELCEFLSISSYRICVFSSTGRWKASSRQKWMH